jgi:hypothetical protein
MYDLINIENVRARQIADAVTAKRMEDAERLSKHPSPIARLNELLKAGNLAINIEIAPEDKINATKGDLPPYGIHKLSDGERSAILIGSTIITAPQHSLFIIDEPERHLHRSIIVPLLAQAFAVRPDCAYIISTHDVGLPTELPNSKVILVRGCGQFEADSPREWDVDIVDDAEKLPESLKLDILGARRNILFVEGTWDSLDAPLYSILFPNFSVIPKNTCRDVEASVDSLRGARDYHWLNVYGIVDGDGMSKAQREQRKDRGIYALTSYSLESLYYHPSIQKLAMERFDAATGSPAGRKLQDAMTKALECIPQQSERLISRLAARAVRDSLWQQIPVDEPSLLAAPIVVSADGPTLLKDEDILLSSLLSKSDLKKIVERYPLRETQALTVIAKTLGFANRRQYESTVRSLLLEDVAARKLIEQCFGDLISDLRKAALITECETK